MNVVLFDGYVDEPSCLGVPPFISPYIRYCAGAILDSGHDVTYITIDEYRRGDEKEKALGKSDLLVIIGGAVVPGKYIRGTPASVNEIYDIAADFSKTKVLGGPVARFGFSGAKKAHRLREVFDFIIEKDPDAFVYDVLTQGTENQRLRGEEEWRSWPQKGSRIIQQHPDFPFPLMVELETFRGCVRYRSGGCSFCIEPLFGKPLFRPVKDIADEVFSLSKWGAVNFRLGAQSCIFSYNAEGVGSSEVPQPNPSAVEKLLKGIRAAAPNLEVLHTDNANPAIMAEHRNEVKRILKALIRYCTGGNVLALGMESADPEVIEKNNLNATPEQVRCAAELINEYGKKRGATGMPNLLPGINILSGLKGETKRTFELNFRFLKDILDSGLLLRRINIRQVSPVREKFGKAASHSQFLRFKKKVRETIDHGMLKRLVPEKTVLRRILMEKTQGNLSYGRQVGTYPLLVGIPYKVDEGGVMDVIITSHGQRSVTGIEHPLNVNAAPLRALSSLPKVGKKRAARIARARPFSSHKDFLNALDDKKVASELLDYISLN
ncbi:MAG: radical SAM protein [Thermoplasmata archaeon]|nr:MAG: radical SAM protein [Thermoplasmata archaeon]